MGEGLARGNERREVGAEGECLTWFRIDDGFADHPKVIRCSLAAIGLWTKAGAWCSKHLTDGCIPKDMVRVWGGTPRLASELVAAGLWNVTQEGYEFHEWSARNPTRDAVTKRRAEDADRKREERRSTNGHDANVLLDRRRSPNGHDADSAQTPNGVKQESSRARPRSRPVPSRPSPSHPDQTKQDPDCDGGADGAKPIAAEAVVLDDLADIRSAVWRSYAHAYRTRYGVDPVRNAKVNGQIAQFVKRVPASEAPSIAAAYVRSRNARYVAAGHSIGCLLQDAEKLRTEAVTGKNGTLSAARHEDHTADRADKYAEMFARLDAEESAAKGLAHG